MQLIKIHFPSYKTKKMWTSRSPSRLLDGLKCLNFHNLGVTCQNGKKYSVWITVSLSNGNTLHSINFPTHVYLVLHEKECLTPLPNIIVAKWWLESSQVVVREWRTWATMLSLGVGSCCMHLCISWLLQVQFTCLACTLTRSKPLWGMTKPLSTCSASSKTWVPQLESYPGWSTR